MDKIFVDLPTILYIILLLWLSRKKYDQCVYSNIYTLLLNILFLTRIYYVYIASMHLNHDISLQVCMYYALGVLFSFVSRTIFSMPCELLFVLFIVFY